MFERYFIDYLQGYFTLIPTTWPHQSLITDGDRITLGNARGTETKQRSSFFM